VSTGSGRSPGTVEVVVLIPMALVAGLLAVVVTGGRFRRVFTLQLRMWPLVVIGAALLAVLRRTDPPGAVMLLVVSLAVRGMPIVLTGLAMNALCVVVNQGMPVRLPADASAADHAAYADSASHHVERPEDRLMFLADVLVLPSPVRVPVSYGDLVLVAGLVGVIFRLGRPVGQHAATIYQHPAGRHREGGFDGVATVGLQASRHLARAPTA
jgi:Family of unknown function (DUF5317)